MGPAGLRVLVATALATFLVAWLGYRAWARSDGEPLPWRDRTEVIAGLRLVRATSEVFREPEELDRFLALHGEPPRRRATIDFERNLAVLVALGPRSSSGYAVEVVRAEEQRRRVVVVVSERAPSRGERLRRRLHYPLRLIELPDAGKPLDLEWR